MLNIHAIIEGRSKISKGAKEIKDFRGVSLKRELVEQVERFVVEHPEYKNIADFVHEAVRVRMEEIRKSYPVALPRFEYFIDSEHNEVRVTDRKINRQTDIYFTIQGIYCELDKTNDCQHIQYILTIPEIQEIIKKKRKEGWQKLPDI